MPSLHRDVGALSFPLADTNATDFSSLDPARDVLLALLVAAINDEIGPRWADAVAGSKLTAAALPVVSSHPFAPDQETLQQLKAKLPALFVYRDPAFPVRCDEFTLHQRRYTCRWGIDYFLGPLDVGDRGKLGDVLHAVGKLVRQVIWQGGHKAHASQTLDSGVTQPRLVLGAGGCGFSTVEVVEYQAGAASLSREAPKYWACSCVLETTELDAPGAEALLTWYDGTTATLGTGDASGEVTVVVADTDDALDVWDP